MAGLIGADVIAITDHNSSRNCAAVIEAAGDKLIVIAGMEIWTEEDVHLLCLFPSAQAAESFSGEVYKALPYRRCDAELFGQQYILDAEDRIIGWEEKLLAAPTELRVDEVASRVSQFGGCIIPAHVDRTYSLVAQLGFVPPSLCIPFVEVSRRGKQPQVTRAYEVIVNSDAHSLAGLAGGKPWTLEVSRATAEGVIESLLEKCKTGPL
jgi:hypothetical protein